MQARSLSKLEGDRFCQAIIQIDPTILFASVCTLSGKEIASQKQPSANLYLGSNHTHSNSYTEFVSVVCEAFGGPESLFGEVDRIVGTFRNLRVMIIPNRRMEIAVMILMLKEAEVKRMAFGIARIVEKFFAR